VKDAAQYNKTNKLRAIYNNLSVFQLKENVKEKSQYQRVQAIYCQKIVEADNW